MFGEARNDQKPAPKKKVRQDDIENPKNAAENVTIVVQYGGKAPSPNSWVWKVPQFK